MEAVCVDGCWQPFAVPLFVIASCIVLQIELQQENVSFLCIILFIRASS
jgi:hypothetical protein